MAPLVYQNAIHDSFIPAGVSAIQGAVTSIGISSRIYDHGFELAWQNYKKVITDSEYSIIRRILAADDSPIGRPSSGNKISKESLTYKKLMEFTNEILDQNPKWVMFGSMFDCSNKAIEFMARKIKQSRPEIKIVVGGIGLSQFGDFFTRLRHENIIDYTVTGPGEFAVIELLKGNDQYPGINLIPPEEKRDMDGSPYYGFEGIVTDRYANQSYGDEPEFPITASEGCVYRCTYCNVPHWWPKFNWRSPKRIAAEMEYVVNKYNAKRFRFTDSLLNASMPKFRQI